MRALRPVGVSFGLLFVGVLSCRKTSDPAAPMADAQASSSPVASAASAPRPATVAPARCHPEGQGVSLEGGSALADLEVGEAIAVPGGEAVSLVHRTAAGRTAAVALLSSDFASAHVIDLGSTLGDAPAPQLAWRGKDFVAAWFARPAPQARGGAASRQLVVHAVQPNGQDAALLTLAQPADDSLALDLAYTAHGEGLVVWDESASDGGLRGVVRVTAIEGDRAGAPRELSLADIDAESPRVVARGDGFYAFWIARKSDTRATPDASTSLEVVAAPRSNAWLQMAAVDAQGAVASPIQTLTAPSGHVSAYDVALVPGGGVKLLAVVRDDGEAVDGSGGALLRIVVREGGADAPTALVTDGLGRGSPLWVDSEQPWLAWAGADEQLRLFPLDTAGLPLGAPSIEEGLTAGRPLSDLGGSVPPTRRLLVATPDEAVAQLRVFTCSR